MTVISYLKGDAACPQASGIKVIAHICKRWKQPESAYRGWSKNSATDVDFPFRLGTVQFVPVGELTWIANMVAQQGTGTGRNGPPIRYKAVADCLIRVAEWAKLMGASVHMPRIGTGLSGGKWGKIEPLIQEHLCNAGIAVTVYDLK